MLLDTSAVRENTNITLEIIKSWTDVEISSWERIDILRQNH